ncbi:MAG: methyltransferase domain-containing protein [Actinomycetota bacterium]
MRTRRLPTARSLALRALDRASLLHAAYRAYEALRSVRRGADDGRHAADGLPLPPASLRTVVAGTPGVTWFVESGRQQADIIREAFERHGKPVDEADRMLDFGCGCGRVLRHWSDLSGPEIHGSDYNRRLIRWCESNLPFAQFSVNDLHPPLEHESGTFDLAYGISVFTHLPEDLERAWIAELGRILAPGGLLLLTTHGEGYLDRLDAAERERYLAGDAVVRWASVAGTNLCTTFHPEGYVRERLAPELELLEFTPEGGSVGSRSQDLAVFRKPPEAVTRST